MDEKLKKMHSKESRQKSKETRENSIKQFSIPEETETHLLIDYYDRKLRIYTTKATVMNRLERAGYDYTKEETVDGQIWSRSYVFDTSEISKFLRASLFKFDQQRPDTCSNKNRVKI